MAVKATVPQSNGVEPGSENLDRLTDRMEIFLRSGFEDDLAAGLLSPSGLSAQTGHTQTSGAFLLVVKGSHLAIAAITCNGGEVSYEPPNASFRPTTLTSPTIRLTRTCRVYLNHAEIDTRSLFPHSLGPGVLQRCHRGYA